MARDLNLRVIAEGVENEAQLTFLRMHGCDEIQGYLISKPVSALEAAEQIRGPLLHAIAAAAGNP